MTLTIVSETSRKLLLAKLQRNAVSEAAATADQADGRDDDLCHVRRPAIQRSPMNIMPDPYEHQHFAIYNTGPPDLQSGMGGEIRKELSSKHEA